MNTTITSPPNKLGLHAIENIQNESLICIRKVDILW